MVYLVAASANVCDKGANEAREELSQGRPPPIPALLRIPEKACFSAESSWMFRRTRGN